MGVDCLHVQPRGVELLADRIDSDSLTPQRLNPEDLAVLLLKVMQLIDLCFGIVVVEDVRIARVIDASRLHRQHWFNCELWRAA